MAHLQACMYANNTVYDSFAAKDSEWLRACTWLVNGYVTQLSETKANRISDVSC